MMQPTPNETRTHTDELVDIRKVSVDKNLPKEERIAAFIRQIKNPYRFRCGFRRRFCGKRLLCRERCYVGGMSARHFALSDILAFFRRECYDRCGKG